MADSDPDFITPLCSFVDAFYRKEKAIYELQIFNYDIPKNIHISPSNHSQLRPFVGPPPWVAKWRLAVGAWQMIAGDCAQHIPVDVCTSEHLSVSIIFQPMSTVINHHIGSLFGNRSLFIPMLSYCLVLSCVHALCLVLLVLVLFVVLYVFVACSLHVLDVRTIGNEDFVFRVDIGFNSVLIYTIYPQLARIVLTFYHHWSVDLSNFLLIVTK